MKTCTGKNVPILTHSFHFLTSCLPHFTSVTTQISKPVRDETRQNKASRSKYFQRTVGLLSLQQLLATRSEAPQNNAAVDLHSASHSATHSGQTNVVFQQNRGTLILHHLHGTQSFLTNCQSLMQSTNEASCMNCVVTLTCSQRPALEPNPDRMEYRLYFYILFNQHFNSILTYAFWYPESSFCFRFSDLSLLQIPHMPCSINAPPNSSSLVCLSQYVVGYQSF